MLCTDWCVLCDAVLAQNQLLHQTHTPLKNGQFTRWTKDCSVKFNLSWKLHQQANSAVHVLNASNMVYPTRQISLWLQSIDFYSLYAKKCSHRLIYLSTGSCFKLCLSPDQNIILVFFCLQQTSLPFQVTHWLTSIMESQHFNDL